MNSLPTPGPWTIEQSSHFNLSSPTPAIFSGVARVAEVLHSPDAALIAAAPEMADALKSLIDLWTPYLHCVGDVGREKMIAAGRLLARVEGRSE